MKDLIGIQLQSSGLPETITVKEAMVIFCSYHDVEPRYDLLERMGLLDKLNSQYHTLSGGQQKKISISFGHLS